MTASGSASPHKKTHTAGSAAMLLMASALLSGLLALARIKIVNYLFGAGAAQDAYRAAFKLPDLLSYFLTGGAVAISLITVLNRYLTAGDDEGADRALSVVLCTMLVILGIGVVVAEIVAPGYVWLANSGFRNDPLRAHLCTALTRIILPAQLFFFIGSCMSSRLQVRKIFIYQAGAPLVYNLGIILGAIFLHKQLGIYSLAVGVLLGVIFGSFLLNTTGAFRTGFHFTPLVDFRAPAFREWFSLTWPLMIGVSLVMFDGFFLNYFGSLKEGGITLIGNAKDLFNAPFNVIGPAAGAASLPFFASLFQQDRRHDFSHAVSRSVSRLFCVGMLVSAWMIALAPWLMDLFRGGKFHHDDAVTTTHLFVVLAITLAIWAVQGIYARAFYAASDTLTPAITGTIITVASVPLYWLLFHARGLEGLAIASDLGITIQTATLAILLHRKDLVRFAHLEYPELARALFAALLAFAATYILAHHLPPVTTHPGDLLILAAGSLAWLAITFATLHLTGSKLPKQILRRKAA
ncbi:virulence factor MviN [Granulicella sp. 5B5]|uniref:murein biosynthesis integral membrane protein MurJ n=1 Tax=Granulicella sp. 5B5 TaxID=1617967 RepID=UPI0015F52DD1|nr:lipid II flippase MurJ [Granulicella sp. 5B5]QMV18587.1 virulence factor MviN [Granulicella sp. 5B5]